MIVFQMWATVSKIPVEEADHQVFFLNFWVGDLYQNDRMVYTVKKGLNPQLRMKLLSTLERYQADGHIAEASDICLNEAAYAFEAEFGDCTG